MVSIEAIQEMCSGRIAINEPLAPMTSFRIGGPADFYIEPVDRDELIRLMDYFQTQNLPAIVLGNGSNVLISDEGFRGAVLNLESHFSFVRRDGELVRAGAGIRMSAFVDYCIEQGLSGVEMLAGIPGTLGGALVMNAGAYGGEISDHLVDITVIRSGDVTVLSRKNAGFAYRLSCLSDDVLIEASFSFASGSRERMKELRRELLQKRNSSQPTRLPNAGSVFKNPPGSHAARLIETSGLKGLSVGDAEVSPAHANFIVNRGTASAMDVVTLMKQVRAKVLHDTGILLEPELRLVGFDEGVLDAPDSPPPHRSGERDR